MSLQNCRRCGKLYLKQRSDYCPECAQWMAEVYGQIRDFLREFPNKTMWDIHTELAIPLSVIQQVLKELEEEKK